MTTLTRYIELTRNEVEYLKKAGFLPLAMLEYLQTVYWKLDNRGYVEISIEVAEDFREILTEQLAKVGFDETYELTAEGVLLEELIDRFQNRKNLFFQIKPR